MEQKYTLAYIPFYLMTVKQSVQPSSCSTNDRLLGQFVYSPTRPSGNRCTVPVHPVDRAEPTRRLISSSADLGTKHVPDPKTQVPTVPISSDRGVWGKGRVG
jgi:hypothetical protein